MNSQIATVNLIPGLSTPAVVRVSQYDVGRPLTIRVLDGTGAASFGSSVTATIVGTKPSGLGFTESGTITGNTVTLDTTLAMTQEAGMIPTEIRFTTSSPATVIGTANFILAVEPSPHPEGTTDGTYETMGDLQSQLNALDTRVDALEAGGGGSGLTDDVKTALLNCFAHVAWVDANGQDYYDALESALDSGNLSVSLTLSQVSSSNTATSVGYGESYTTTLTASAGYTLNTVSVTMGGVDITSTAYSSGTVSIPSVTGNIVITATAVAPTNYVTDGLFAHWDAIDNQATGTHDSTATTWVDLVNGHTWTAMKTDGTQTWNWGNDGLNFTTNGGSTATNGKNSFQCTRPQTGLRTLEVVFTPANVGSCLGEFTTDLTGITDNTVQVIAMSASDSTIITVGVQNGYEVTSLTSIKSISATYNSSYAAVKAYKNGVELTTQGSSHSYKYHNLTDMILGSQNNGSGLAYGFKGTVHAIRMYSRELTASEIAQNYSVDVDRFSLS